MFHVMTDTVSVPGDEPAVFVIAAPIVLLVTGVLIPLVTGLVTKWTLPSWIKGAMTVVLNAVAAGIAVAVTADGTAVVSNEWLLSTLYGCMVSLIAYAKLFLPAGLTSSSPAGKLAPNVGLGPSVREDPK